MKEKIFEHQNISSIIFVIPAQSARRTGIKERVMVSRKHDEKVASKGKCDERKSCSGHTRMNRMEEGRGWKTVGRRRRKMSGKIV